ncbi:MAG: signal peptidase I [Endomicrobiales bacterium]
MEKAKLKYAVNKLREESLARGGRTALKVLSGSMAPLISAGDEIRIRKVRREEIRVFDIIVWNPSVKREFAPRSYVVHRVLSKEGREGAPRYKTKGDRCLAADKKTVSFEEVLGKVVLVTKAGTGITIRIDTFPGKCFSCASALFSMGVTVISWLLNGLIRVISATFPEGRSPSPAGAMLPCSAYGIEPESWTACLDIFSRWETGLPKTAVADYQIDDNYSEEAVSLIRRGIHVRGVRPEDKDSFDLVISARVLNCIPSGTARAEALKTMRGALKTGGRLILVIVNHERGLIEKYYSDRLRRVYPVVFGRSYAGPAAGDAVVNGCFIRHNYEPEQLQRELQRSGFSGIEITVQGPVLGALAVK